MRAIILAAGLGTRMGSLTKSIPKPLLRLGNTTLIEYNINKLFNSGISKIIINVHHLGNQIQKHLQYYDNLIFSREKQLLDSGGAIVNALPLLTNNFIVINADILFNYNLKKLKLNKAKLATLILVNNPRHNKSGDFKYNNTMLTFSGIGIYDKKMFSNYSIQKIALKTIIEKNLTNINFEHYAGTWLDVGTKQRLRQAQQFISDNPT